MSEMFSKVRFQNLDDLKFSTNDNFITETSRQQVILKEYFFIIFDINFFLNILGKS